MASQTAAEPTMKSPTSRATLSLPIAPKAALAAAAVMALSACERGAVPADAVPAVEKETQPQGEFAWAQAALLRNPHLELLASDERAGVFTVRVKQSDEVLAVKLDEIAAAPPSQLAAPGQARAVEREPERRTVQTSPRTSGEEASAQAAAARQDAAQESGERPMTGAAGSPAAQPSYTIERSDGQLRVSGPGVSIVSANAQQSGAASAATTQRNDEPLICEGRRMLHLDNRTLYVDGDAITVRDGCELFLTNSRVVATGTGVVVRNGVVHVSNSHVEGQAGSFDADAASRMYVRDSTFEGVPRRDRLALVHDQGGNRWR